MYDKQEKDLIDFIINSSIEEIIEDYPASDEFRNELAYKVRKVFQRNLYKYKCTLK